MVIDILSSDITVAGEADFTAATPGALDVAVNSPGSGGLNFEDSNGNLYIEPGDNILLQRLDVNIPYGFGQGQGTHKIGLAWYNPTDATFITIPELAGNSALTIPDLCGIDFQGQADGNGLLIVAPKNTTGLRYNLRLTVIDLNLSMLGLPSELNGLVLPVQYHLRVLHTKPLQALSGGT